MPEKNYVKVPLHKIFDFSIGTNSGLTRSFVNSHKGDIPVYGASSGSNEASYGYLADNLPGVKYFENCLTYNKDGASGLLFYRQGRFSLSEKVVPLIIFPELAETLDYLYLKYAIEEITARIDYTYSNKATKVKFKDLVVSIPVMGDGSYDLARQKDLADKYRQVEKQRDILLDRIHQLKNRVIALPQDHTISWAQVTITKLFTPMNGNSKYTKAWCKDHPGDIPLYSGNTVEKYADIDEFMYEGEYLTWAKDGLAGYIMYHQGRFSITGHRGILIPTEACKNIDLRYMQHVLEPIFRKKKKGREGALGKNEYTTLNSAMINRIEEPIPIPVCPDGTYDLAKQRELAESYEQISSIKEQLIGKVQELLRIRVLEAP